MPTSVGKKIIIPSLLILGLCAMFPRLGAADDWLVQIARLLNIHETPSQMKGPGDSLEGGNIFIVDIGDPPRQVTTDGGYRSPVFLPGNAGLLALKGDEVVRLPLSGGTGQKLQSVSRTLKLLGVDASDANRVLVLLEASDGGSELGMLALKNGQLTPLPHDRDSKNHRHMMNHLHGDDREYENGTVYVKTESKASLGGQVEWTDVYVKQMGAAPINISRCDGVDCGQPALSLDGERVVFIKAAAAR